MENQTDMSCFVPVISVWFQKSYFYYINWLSPVTMLLSVWCFVSNGAVTIALFRSGIKSVRPGLLMLCSLTFTDLLWGATVAPVHSGFRLKHLLNSQVCEVYSEIMEIPLLAPTVINHVSRFAHITIISIDRYLAVKHYVEYKFLVTRRRAIVACTVVWVVSIALGTLRQVFGHQSRPLNVMGVGICILEAAVTISLQFMTLRLLRRHNNTVAEMTAEGNQVNAANTANAAIERKLSQTTTYVVGVLALIFIPASFAFVLTAITNKPYTKLLGPVVIPLVTLCSGINPVLYYQGNEKVKQGIAKLVKCQ